MPLLRGRECLSVLRCPASTLHSWQMLPHIELPVKDSMQGAAIISSFRSSRLESSAPSGYTMRPSTGLAAIFLSIIVLNVCMPQPQAVLASQGLHDFTTISDAGTRHSYIMQCFGVYLSKALAGAHLLVMVLPTLEENDRADDADGAHEHGEHKSHCHAAQHLSIPLRGNNIQVKVCPRPVVALQMTTGSGSKPAEMSL